MADNVVIDPGAGGATVATDDVAGIHYQRVKLVESTAESTTPTGVSANPLRVDPTGTTAQPVTDNGSTLSVDDGGGNISIDDGGNTITVDGTVAISGAIDTELPAAAALADNTANPTVPGVGSFDHVWDGATWDRLPGNSTDGALVNLGANNDVTLGAALPAGTNNIGDVDIASLPDEGQQTMANSISVAIASNQSAIPVSDNSGSLTVDNAGTFAVQESGAALTALQLIDNLVTTEDTASANGDSGLVPFARRTATPANQSGTDGDYEPLQMSAGRLWTSAVVDTALPAGTNNIGDVDIASIAAGDNNIGNVDVVTLPSIPAGTNNIGDVDVLSVVPGTSATSLGKAEDAAHGGGDTGVMAMGVRRDANTSLVDTDGDYAPFQVDSAGSLKVAIISGAGSGGTAMTDDAAFTAGTTSITPAGGVYQATPDQVNDGDGGALRMTIRRALYTAMETPNGDSAMDDTNDALRVNVVAGSGSGVSHTDDAAFTPATDDVVPIAGVFDDTTPDSVDEGDAGAVRMSANRNLYVNIRDNAGNERGLNVDASGRIGVTDGGSSLTVDNGGTFAVQVDAAIPAGTNNIGDVDVLSVVPGTGATNLGKAEDAAHTSGDVGVMALSVRQDTAAALGQTDADYQPLITDGSGRLHVAVGTIAAGDNNIGNVDIVTMPNVTIGTNANLTESLVDDAAFTPATSRVLPVGFTFDDSSPDSVNEGDIGAARMSANRNIYATIRDAAGNERGLNVDASGQIAVTLGAAVPAGTNNIGDVDVASIAAGDNNIGNVDIVTMPNVTLAAGTNTNEVVGDVAQDVAVAGNPLLMGGRASTATPTAMSADGDSVYLWTTREGAAVTSGNVAHDGVDAGNPHKIGGRALAHGTNPSAVAAADRTDWLFNRAGIPWVIGGHPNIVTLEAAYTAAQTDAAIITISTGSKIVVTQIQMTADNANSVDVGFRVGFGTANTPTTTGVVLTHPGVAAGSGVSRGDGSGILGIGADNEDLRITSEVPTSGSIRILVSYYTIES